MDIAAVVKSVVAQKGCSQLWIAQKMNCIEPSINMSSCKFSAIVHNKRKMSGEELIAFCVATETSPDAFFEPRAN